MEIKEQHPTFLTASDDDNWSDADEEVLAHIDVDINGCLVTHDDEVRSKYSLECDRILESEGTPLQRYRPNYLIVSDLATQLWCEQQLLYNFSPEVYLTRIPAGEEVKIEEDAEVKAAKGKGSDIHLARELEVHIPVEVPVETREDKWGVKLLNLLTAIQGLYGRQHIAREVPVFGCPFESRLFIYGIVDEIRYDPSNHSLEISELKTRRSSHEPRRSHQEKDKFQVGMYRQLFNELVRSKVTKAMVGDHLKLDLTRPLGKGLVAHIKETEALGCGEGGSRTVDLDHLLDTVFDKIQSLTCIESGKVEYVHQESKLTIAVVQLDRDEDQIGRQFEPLARWWTGVRGTAGVEVEDCWKCQYCPFSAWCEWREVMATKTSKPWKKNR